MKNILKKIHLWLGLSSGLVVFIVAITGCIYVFKEEIQNATQDFRFVAASNDEFVKPSKLLSIAQKELPLKKIHAIMYHKKGKAAKVIFYEYEKKDYYFVYLNPYSGKVLKVVDVNQDFFSFILEGHFYLWLPEQIGQVIVASATLIFVFLLISGFIIWIPNKKKMLKSALSFQWKNYRWRRKNYDLHRILGVYVLLFGFIFSITGLVWGFTWFRNSYYYTITGGKSFVEYSEPKSDTSENIENSLDNVWTKMNEQFPLSGWMELHIPESKNTAIALNINPDEETFWKTDYIYLDQKSLKEIKVNHQWGRFKNTSNSEKLMKMNYDIHVGSIFGLFGKIIAFCASLIIASLPFTGFLIWWGRRKKIKKI